MNRLKFSAAFLLFVMFWSCGSDAPKENPENPANSKMRDNLREQITNLTSAASMAFSPIDDRITEELKAPNSEGLADLQKAMIQYNAKEYAAAIPIFENHLSETPEAYDENKVEFYLALSYLGNNQTANAHDILTDLVTVQDFEWKDDVCGYLANTFYEVPIDKPLHVDYAPTYRTEVTNSKITHVDYTEKELIMYLCYVAPENKLPLAMVNGNWSLNAHPKSAEAYQKAPNAVKNIRINNQLQHLNVCTSEEFEVKRGDILTFQLHFLRPSSDKIKLVSLKASDFGGEELAYNDVMLKDKNNRFLGHYEDLPTTLKLFYDKCEYVRYPDIVKFVTLHEELEKQRISEEEKAWLVNAQEPIKYMPAALREIKDLECSKRLILDDIQFKDNSADYAQRVEASTTLGFISQFMTEYPKAKIVLHGHTDILGDEEGNMELSRERVAMVKRTLRVKGADPDRIITLFYGGSQPLLEHHRGGKANRRVEVEVFCGIDNANGPQVEVSDVTHGK